jgi:prephenate dehydratase
LKLGVLGPEGTNSEKAARRWMPDAELVYFDDFEDVLLAAESGLVDAGVVPLENSLEGAVGLVMDLLLRLDVKIIAEVNEPIRHCLLGQGNGEIKVILSHPQALGQCRRYVREHYPKSEVRSTGSTAHAAKLAQEFPEMAAIASAGVADKYGLKVLARDIQDGQDNVTRFAVAGKEMPSATGRDKTSLAIRLDKDRPGALCSILNEFSVRTINLTRIESRPSRKGLGDYYFFIDLEGHISDPSVVEALKFIHGNAVQIKILGSYPRI